MNSLSPYLMHNLIFGISLLLLDTFFIYSVILKKYLSLFTKLNLKIDIKKNNIIYAIITYIILISSFYLIYNQNPNTMILNSIILGLAIYGTYAFTLATILPYYDIYYALLDTLWGVVLFTLSTIASIFIYRNLL